MGCINKTHPTCNFKATPAPLFFLILTPSFLWKINCHLRGLTAEGQIAHSAEIFTCSLRESRFRVRGGKGRRVQDRNRMTSSNQVFTYVLPSWHACVSDLTIFLVEENVSCLNRLAGSPRSRGGRVAQPTSGSVEADSPHLHQTAALFWHGSENWPWWLLISGGLWKNWGWNTLCFSPVPFPVWSSLLPCANYC